MVVKGVDREAERAAALAVREHIASTVDERAVELVERLYALTEATRPYWVTCPKCGKRSEIEVTDASGAIKAVEALLNQGLGRPQGAASKSGFSFRRELVQPDGD